MYNVPRRLDSVVFSKFSYPQHSIAAIACMGSGTYISYRYMYSSLYYCRYICTPVARIHTAPPGGQGHKFPSRQDSKSLLGLHLPASGFCFSALQKRAAHQSVAQWKLERFICCVRREHVRDRLRHRHRVPKWLIAWVLFAAESGEQRPIYPDKKHECVMLPTYGVHM